MKAIVIMGEPGTGKTTLMRRFMDLYGENWTLQTDSDFPLVPHHYDHGTKTVILGKYEQGETFAGTDRMSMAVQPQAVEFVKILAAQGATLVFEGDRLTNQSFLEFLLNNYQTSIIYLKVEDAERERRYAERGSNQSEQFIKGRVTKYANLRTNFDIMMALEEFTHMTPEDTDLIVSHIIEKVKF